MLFMESSLSSCFLASLLSCFSLAILLHFAHVKAVIMPSSSCYALDNTSHLVDFTDWIGHVFQYEGKAISRGHSRFHTKDDDLVVRFCKDVEWRSQAGYIDFGRYQSNYFMAGSGPVDFVQRYYNGDLKNCELSFDKMGRTAEVEIICGSCLNGECKEKPGCICGVTYDQTFCRVSVELAIPCTNPGSRVFQGFTVGFHPRTWELVYNGMTQLGYEKLHQEFSFGTEQTHLSLYLTAISSLSGLVKKPKFKVNPDNGLEVKMTGSAESGRAPTTLSPTVLNIFWRCEVARERPYEIEIIIPVDGGYDPVGFTLTKLCDYRQGRENDATNGWATFGVLSCIFVVLSTIICCGGFIYKIRVEHQRGLDALPGVNILSALLETVTGTRCYAIGQDGCRGFVNQASWERPSDSVQSQRTDESRYGSI